MASPSTDGINPWLSRRRMLGNPETGKGGAWTAPGQSRELVLPGAGNPVRKPSSEIANT